MKLTSAFLAVLCLCLMAGSASFGRTLPTPATLEAGWMYLSVADDHYDPGLDEPRWDSGFKDVYLIVEKDDADWDPSIGYYGMEGAVTFSPNILQIAVESPQAPAPLIIQNCDATHCDFGIGTGGAVFNNPWMAVRMQFLTLAPVDNLLFTLEVPGDGTGEANWPASERLMGNPGWALFDAQDPPLEGAKTTSSGSGADHKPAWNAGIVLLNYNPATISQEMLDELGDRVQSAGHPLWMRAIPIETASWGELKANFK